MAEEKKILVIDDEKRMADSLQELLSNYDYTVEVAYSGKEAIGKLKKEHYHLAITDLRMVELDGFDVMDYIVNHSSDTLTIVITAHASTESAIEALHYKAFDYITKPFDFELLKASVEKAFLKIESENLREEMIHMITHDIKLPLTSIIGFANMVFDKKTGEVHPKAAEFSNAIYLNSQKLLSLIDNYLTSCKINAGRLSICETEVNISPILEDLVDIIRLGAEKQQISLDVNLEEDIPAIKGDENLLFRAIGNVLYNAMKYTPDKGSVSLKTGQAPAMESPLHASSLYISVSNSGPGIPREELSGIFDRYERSETMKGIEGSGLGLYVLKNIIKAHNGTVTVDSVPHTLTTFTIYLPLP